MKRGETRVASRESAGQSPGFLLAAVLLAVVTLLPYLLSRHLPIWTSEGIFGYLARAAHDSHLPLYRAAVDNKPPGVLWLYQALHGWDAAGVFRVRVAEGVMVYLTALLVMGWGWSRLGWYAGLVAGFGLAILTVAQVYTEALTEAPMILFTTLAFWLLWRGVTRGKRGYFAGAGLALAAAFTCKQVAAFDLIAALGFLVTARELSSLQRRFSAVLLLAAGYAAGLLALGLLMLAQHQFPEFWSQVVTSIASGGVSPERGERLAHLAALWPPLAGWWTPLGLAVLGCLAPVREELRPLRRLVAWWLPLTCLGFLSSGFLYFHQALGFFPPLALGTGLALVWIHDRLLPRLQVRTALVLTLAFLLWIEPLALYQALIVTHLRRDYPLELTYPQALGPWLDRHLPPGATFYVVGVEVPLYLYSGRRAASRYPYGGWTSRQVHETILRDFDAEPPAALIFSTPLNFPPLNDLGAMIRAWPGFVGYQRVPQPVPGGYELYLRQDLAAGIAP